MKDKKKRGRNRSLFMPFYALRQKLSAFHHLAVRHIVHRPVLIVSHE